METTNGDMANGDSKPDSNGSMTIHNGVGAEMNGDKNNHTIALNTEQQAEEEMGGYHMPSIKWSFIGMLSIPVYPGRTSSLVNRAKAADFK